jgi:hypothetical protein
LSRIHVTITAEYLLMFHLLGRGRPGTGMVRISSVKHLRDIGGSTMRMAATSALP